MTPLKQILSNLHTATPSSVELLASLFVPVSFKKGMILHTPDHSFPILYLIGHGLLRGYFEHEAEEHTSWIMEEGFLLPLGGFFINQPGTEQVEFLADTKGWSLNLAKAEIMALKEPLMYRMIVEIYEKKLLEARTIEYMLRLKKAQDRIVFIQKLKENMIYRGLNRHVASFLNVGDKYLFSMKKTDRGKSQDR
jgi:CRP-like cAMP-binding protein